MDPWALEHQGLWPEGVPGPLARRAFEHHRAHCAEGPNSPEGPETLQGPNPPRAGAPRAQGAEAQEFPGPTGPENPGIRGTRDTET